MKALRQPARWLLAGVVVYLILAITSAPAGLLFRWFAPDEISATGMQGSIWNGSAAQVSGAGLRATEVSWSAKPVALLSLKAGAEVEAKIQGGRIKANIYQSLFGRSGTAENIKAVIDLDDLNRIINTQLLVTGTAGVILEQIAWQEDQLADIRGEITLAELHDTISGTRLGTFELEFPGTETPPIRGIVRDVDAVFGLSGTLGIEADGSYQFDALIQPGNDTPASVVQALPIIGAVRDRDGNFVLTSSGSLYTGR